MLTGQHKYTATTRSQSIEKKKKKKIANIKRFQKLQIGEDIGEGCFFPTASNAIA